MIRNITHSLFVLYNISLQGHYTFVCYGNHFNLVYYYVNSWKGEYLIVDIK